jgi:hypothetical protein
MIRTLSAADREEVLMLTKKNRMNPSTHNMQLPYGAQTKAEQKIIREARKLGLIMEIEASRGPYAQAKLEEIALHTMEVGRRSHAGIDDIRAEEGLSEQAQDYVDALAEVLSEQMNQQLMGVALTAGRNIGEATYRSLYFADEPEEDKNNRSRGFLQRLLGG